MSLDAGRMQFIRERGRKKKVIHWIPLIRMRAMNIRKSQVSKTGIKR